MCNLIVYSLSGGMPWRDREFRSKKNVLIQHFKKFIALDLMLVRRTKTMNKKPDLAALFGATETKTFLGLEACSDFSSIDA